MTNALDHSAKGSARPKYSFFVFGDSLSDIGNVYRKTIGLFPPSPPYYKGRLSNGPLAVETLAQQLGLPLSLRTDFAIGGARTDRTNTGDQGLLKLGGLLDEIDQFKAKAKSLGAGAEDLYLVWAGSNDFLKLLDKPPANPNTVITNAVKNIVSSVRTLSQSKAKNIVVAEMPDLGAAPLIRRSGQSQAIRQLSQRFNVALRQELNQFKLSSPKTNLILTDLFKITDEVVNHPGKYGFTNVTGPAIGKQNINPAKYLFWDNFHPTTRGHSIFAERFQNTIISGIKDAVIRKGTDRDDRLVGFSGNDRLDGWGGTDFVAGHAGNDSLLGGAGSDTITGGSDRDTLTGGEGQDFMTGGSGRDHFIYNNAKEGSDTITDFEIGQDLIDLRGIFNLSTYDRSNRFDQYVQLTSINQGTLLQVDSNGNKSGGFKTLATLAGMQASDLGASSFLVKG